MSTALGPQGIDCGKVVARIQSENIQGNLSLYVDSYCNGAFRHSALAMDWNGEVRCLYLIRKGSSGSASNKTTKSQGLLGGGLSVCFRPPLVGHVRSINLPK